MKVFFFNPEHPTKIKLIALSRSNYLDIIKDIIDSSSFSYLYIKKKIVS